MDTVNGHKARAVANFFLELDQGRVFAAPGGLSRYVCLAHGWHLSYYDRPLIRESVEITNDLIILGIKIKTAQMMVPAVFYYGGENFTAKTRLRNFLGCAYSAEFSDTERALMTEVYENYSKLDLPLFYALWDTYSPWRYYNAETVYWEKTVPNATVKSFYDQARNDFSDAPGKEIPAMIARAQSDREEILSLHVKKGIRFNDDSKFINRCSVHTEGQWI